MNRWSGLVLAFFCVAVALSFPASKFRSDVASFWTGRTKLLDEELNQMLGKTFCTQMQSEYAYLHTETLKLLWPITTTSLPVPRLIIACVHSLQSCFIGFAIPNLQGVHSLHTTSLGYAALYREGQIQIDTNIFPVMRLYQICITNCLKMLYLV